MLSLGNVFGAEELEAWQTRVGRLLERDDFAFVCEPKIDGLAISLIFEDGRFTVGATRGDGLRGEEITTNLRTIRSLPLVLNGSHDAAFEVRGEVYLSQGEFERLNRERAASGEQLYMNPRNTAAGSLRQLGSEEDRKPQSRPLRVPARLDRGYRRVREPVGGAGAAARGRVPGKPARAPPGERRGGGGVLPRMGAPARRAGLRDRRRGDQGRRLRAPARTGRRRARAALGDSVEVPGGAGGDAAAEDPGIGGSYGRADAVRGPRTGERGRSQRAHGNAAQRRSRRGARHPGRRRRDHPAGWRCHPAGGRARALPSQGPKTPTVQDAHDLSGVRRPGGPRPRGGRLLLPQHRVPGPGFADPRALHRARRAGRRGLR